MQRFAVRIQSIVFVNSVDRLRDKVSTLKRVGLSESRLYALMTVFFAYPYSLDKERGYRDELVHGFPARAFC